jgi:hypothetical protein
VSRNNKSVVAVGTWLDGKGCRAIAGRAGSSSRGRNNIREDGPEAGKLVLSSLKENYGLNNNSE